MPKVTLYKGTACITIVVGLTDLQRKVSATFVAKYRHETEVRTYLEVCDVEEEDDEM
jgi:hypothetical protein